MENEFAKVMSERTDEELIKIVTVERERYIPTAIEAADTEVEKRNIDTSEFEKIRKKVIAEKEQKEKVDSNVVSSGIRFVNLIIDSIVWYILIVIVFFIVGLIFPTYIINNNFTVAVINLILIFGSFFAYHSIMEIKFQKTIGKFLTKTKVVKLNGENPTNGDIINRTFCRLIPFDRVSFLFAKNGIHDFLSKTKVVKDNVE
ncbi:MAG: RDD family protein [Winogradskyella sp.]|uniref:RDD family protein n=1 Tax=Winogradskyella sp. TaxID=1883156 RepID=UPI000F3E02D6|nr:RDD family protein [Winogradskyella sp.]RNC86933.1 MAG: RDD family protein [Winogradskyella sp.]